MGEIIRLLAIDDNAERISKIAEQISKQDPDLHIEYPLNLKSLIQLIETNSYDGIISPLEISQLNRTELIQRLSNVINLPVINYLGDTRPPESTQQYDDLLRDKKTDEDTLPYRILAERIKQTLRTRKTHGKTTLLPFPDTPKVVVRGKGLYILYEDGSEEFWGLEIESDIEEIAAKMEMELRAVKWVKNEIVRVIGDLTEIMMYTDVPEQEIPYIIFDGYRSLLFCFKKINESINRL